MINRAIARAEGRFNVGDLKRECPGVSIDMIRRVLKNLQAAGQIECLGRGQNAFWRKKGK
jgi:DNA-binding HxlR family transcriptional regulator